MLSLARPIENSFDSSFSYGVLFVINIYIMDNVSIVVSLLVTVTMDTLMCPFTKNKILPVNLVADSNHCRK